MAATNKVLERIHALVAQAMLDKLESGEAEAKDWAVIIKFLQQNGIDALTDPNKAADDAFTRLMAKAQESIARHQ